MKTVKLSFYEQIIIKLALRKAIENSKSDEALEAFTYVLTNFEYKTTGV